MVIEDLALDALSHDPPGNGKFEFHERRRVTLQRCSPERLGHTGVGYLKPMTDERRHDRDRDGPEDIDDLVDEWGEDSFPASDPPGDVPPNLALRPKSTPRGRDW